MLRLHAMKEAVTSREGAILAREATLSTTLLNLAPLNSTRLKVTLLVNSNLVNVTLVDSHSLDALVANFTLLNVTLVDSTTLEEVRSDKLSPKLTDSLKVYERLRHRARLRLIALGVSEGMTAADIQRHWSITRQLTSRALHEVQLLDDDR